MDFGSQEVWNIFSQTVTTLVQVGSGAGCIVGLGLLFFPRQIQWLNTKLSTWVSTRRFGKPFEFPVGGGSSFYRHSLLTGFFLLIFIFYMGYQFSWNIPKSRWMAMLGLSEFKPWEIQILAVCLVTLYVIMMAWILWMAVMMIFWPKKLQEVERSLDKWYSTRRMTQKIAKPFYGHERWLLAHPRTTGIVLLLGSFFVLITLK